tara:strand:- start:2662 stop:3276 length:615 start_codon:yes stop_codon:yes gene_type:complete
MKVAIINYGMGNLKSIIGSLNYLGIQDIIVTHDLEEINTCDKIILPGVGAFKEAMKNIKELKLDETLRFNVIEREKPILGICLGMQLMCTYSEEGGLVKGLDFVNGGIKRFKEGGFKVPHIGINSVVPDPKSNLFYGLNNNRCQFYFVHSYKLELDENCVASFTNYISNFTSSYEKENITGVQFHPELSQKSGLKVLSNFLSKI